MRIMTHLKPADYVVSTWSGGTTTQISIAPEGAVYADRDFHWRLSSATVDLEESDFTALPDYKRYIATLDGEIDVIHNAGEPVHLAPYKVHAFDGGWQTRSIGRCRDFNLMLRKGACDGLLESVYVKECMNISVCEAAGDEASLLLYLCEGEAVVEAGGEKLKLMPGEAVLIRKARGIIAQVSSEKGAVIMKAQVWK